MKSSFCIDLQRFMLIPTKFPLSRQKPPNSLKTMDIKIKSKQEATFSKQKNKGLALPIPLSVSFIVQYDSI